MSLQSRRVQRLREQVAVANDSRPTWVKLCFVRTLFQDLRIDVEFEWMGDNSCLVHTTATSARGALRAAELVVEHIKPGRRLKAGNPTVWEEYRG